jgi:hypothetical protein
MNSDVLQGVLDRLSVTSAQRFALVTSAVAALIVASWATTVAAGSPNVGMPLLAAVFALAAIARVDSHVGLVAVGLVVGQWAFTVDDTTTASAIAVGACLYVFHAAVSLMSATPISATVSGDVLRRWALRSVVVAVAVCWTWLTVVALAERQTSASVALSAFALVSLAALLLVARVRVVNSSAPR